MADDRPYRLVAVYESEESAREAAAAARRAGAAPSEVRVDEPLDRVVAMKGEMREELDHTMAGPGVAPHTKETAHGMFALGALGAIIGAVVALPFAAIGFGGWPFWERVLVVVIVGAIFGGTIGCVIGGGFGARRPQESLAAERGITVATPAREDFRRALIEASPVRLDIVDPAGHAFETLATEGDNGIPRTMRE